MQLECGVQTAFSKPPFSRQAYVWKRWKLPASYSEVIRISASLFKKKKAQTSEPAQFKTRKIKFTKDK